MEKYDVICVGTGEIGRPLYELLNGVYKTLPVDPVHFKENMEVNAKCDYLHICIPSRPDFTEIVINLIKNYHRPKFVFIHSTVTPGTTDSLNAASQGMNLNSWIIHAPVHGKHHNNQMKKDMLRYRKYLGIPNLIEEDYVNEILEHFKRVGFADIKIVWGPQNTEWLKILSTTYFGLQIAWAQEVERICDKFGLSYEQVTDFFSIQEDIKPPHYPGKIGGHCVMPNIDIIGTVYDSLACEFIKKSDKLKSKRDS